MPEHPVIERYVTRFDTSLDKLNCPDRDEIVDEIRNHIAESRGAGKPLETILEALGPADELARAYAAELLLNPRRGAIRRLAAITAFVAAAGIATVIVVGALGSVGIGFSVSGIAMLLIGILEATDIHLPGVRTNGISPIWDIVLGPVVIAIGLASVALLRLYLRFILRTFRRVLPRVRTPLPAVPRNM